MKKYLLLLIIAIWQLNFSAVKAQPYQSLFGNSNTSWKIVTPNLDIFTTDSVTTEGDTIFNTHNYKKIYSDYPSYSNMLRGFLREDTVAGKVWYYSLSDTTERLIMDLKLLVGDSFLVTANWLVNPGWKMVDSVYSVLGKNYIRINCLTEWGDKLIFIEGIGTNVGIQYLAQNNLNIAPYLLCSYKDSILAYTNNNMNFNHCELITTIPEEKDPEHAIKIFPNPTSGQAILRFNNPNNTRFIFTIFDISGMKINELETNSSSIIIEKDMFNSGIYFYKLYNIINSNSYCGKIIFINR